MKIIATMKGTNEEIVLEHGVSEEYAERFCEMWGWSYDDGKYSYWLNYEEE